MPNLGSEMGIQKTTIGAVLTGDIVDSTKLLPTQEARLLELLALFLKEHVYEFYRGDSFQAYITEPSQALQLALALRALAIDVTGQEESEVRADIRIAIGIGKVNLPIGALGSAKGEAFLLSGRELDQLQQTERRLAITCEEPVANIGFEVMADYLDAIYRGMTGKQANVIVELLRGVTQQQLAISRDKAKSTISEIVNAGRWPEIGRVLQQYERLIKLLP